MKRSYLFLMSLLVAAAIGAQTPDYLCFTSDNYTTLKITKGFSPYEVSLQYSRDAIVWTDYTFQEPEEGIVYASGEDLFVDIGDKLYFRNAYDAAEVPGFSSYDGYYFFSIYGSGAFSGNVMSLVDKSCQSTTIPCEYCFYQLFNGCAITTAPELPATTLKDNCYYQMFRYCDMLTTAPELPATTMASNCYYGMFERCTSLTTAPELPATTMAGSCYYSMFEGCTQLTDIKVAIQMSYGTIMKWVEGVPSNGTFTCPEDCNLREGENGIPSGWDIKHTYDINVSDIGWASMYVNLPLDIPNGVEVYYASKVEGNAITLDLVYRCLPPRTAVIVKANPGTVSFPIYNDYSDLEPIEGNLFAGTSVDKDYEAGSVYVLAGVNAENGTPQFKNYTGTKLGAHKAYLPKSVLGDNAASSIEFRIGGATVIDMPLNEPNADEQPTYNVLGQPVPADHQGIVIRRGRKIMNR